MVDCALHLQMRAHVDDCNKKFVHLRVKFRVATNIMVGCKDVIDFLIFTVSYVIKR